MPEKLNFIVSENSFEKFMMHVILGTTGSALDMKMNFFFTFWGLELLKKKFKPKVAGMPFPMKGIAAKMFRKKLKSFGYEDIWEMVQDGVEEGNIRLIPCGMSMDLMGIEKEELHDFVEEPVGAAKFLSMADGAHSIISL
mgnify:CR=1 FL=1